MSRTMGGTSAGRVRMWFKWAAAMAVLATSACAPPMGGGGGTPPGSTATVLIGAETVTVSVATSQTVTVSPTPPGSVPAAPSGVSFPLGALSIDVQNVAPGAVAHVTIVVQHPVTLVRKLIGGAWDPFFSDGTTGASVSADGLTISLDLQDGGRGDSDGVANGTIVDPVAPADATTLTITSDEVPLMTIGQPYSYQLTAAGATGPVTWSVGGYSSIVGTLPAGIRLDPATGVLSGTPSQTAFFFFQARATDQVGSTAKLLALFTNGASPGGLTSNGVALPDGNAIFFSASPAGGASGPLGWLGTYSHDGTISPDTSLSVHDFAKKIAPALYNFPLAFNREGTQVVTADGPGGTGPINVRDADTGAVIATPVSSPAFTLGEASFSPDGSHLEVRGQSGPLYVFDTATWAITMSQPCCGSGQLRTVWSPTGSEFTFDQPTGGGPSSFLVFSASAQPVRTVTVPGCTQVLDWSQTNRLALGCIYNDLATASAVDGTNVRILVGTTCPPNFVFPCTAGVEFGRFSTSGGYLATSIATYTATGNPTYRLAVVPDTPSPSPTVLTDAAPADAQFPITWG